MKSAMRHDDYSDEGCGVEACLEVIGGKWKGVILHHLLDGSKRFGELRQLLGEVSQRILTLQLRELEEAGVLSRTVYAEVPPRVEYQLTEFGRTLQPMLMMMQRWGLNYLHKIS